MSELPLDLPAEAKLAPDGRHLQLTVDGQLSALLGWLGTLAVAEIAIAPVGLQSVYQRFHRGSVAANGLPKLGENEQETSETSR